ncbi:alpha/beta fold hydrolase [Thermosipho atlanticus]|uniref:Pimeloyl-ACP methyl ester carboxylesterase n=1 Tax=Thermosipho atlanticus DSM 15807 TaxID=1123380 RepID=A0A1M5R5N3_9BACT|nr:alpha/beta hydrolase [Thermosipho atlanticus]SHH21694.1 Pimeloyl-ACP methyl ester carboxylesterase [Thermosipho atlanticus DSM 15807]
MGYINYNRYSLYYETMGNGEPLLMIHGNTASSIMLKEEALYYSKYYKVILIDMIGHGKSKRLKVFPEDYWYENVKILSKLCDKLNLNKINILGVSGGAILGLNFAIYNSQIVNKVIADSFIGEKLTLQEAYKIKDEREIAKRNGVDQFWKSMHGEEWETVVDADSKMLINYAKKYGDNFKNNLDKITCPVLITGSLKDNLINDIDKKLLEVAKKIKTSLTIFTSDGNHPLMISKKKFFRNIAIRFLNGNL